MIKTKVDLAREEVREKVFMEIIGHLLRYNDAEKRYIADEAQVHWGTLYAWTHGNTLRPRIDTLSRVARAMGYELTLSRVKAKVPRLRRVK